MAIKLFDASAQYNLISAMNRLNSQQEILTKRLTTGKKTDDPTIAVSVAPIDQELAAIGAAQDNAKRADQMLNVAGGAMTQISSLISSISGLVARSANTSGITDAERSANQMQIDSAIESIDRIVQSTEFNGNRLLDGTQSIRTSLSSGDASRIKDVRVYSRPSGVTNTNVTVNVSAAAAKASTTEAGWVDMAAPNATLSAATTMTISGELGTTTITIASGEDRAGVIDAINAVTDITGVTAATSGAGGVKLESQNTGADAFVSVTVLSGDGDFMADGNVTKTSGTDATVTVNGMTAGVDGNKVNFVGAGYSVSFTLADTTTGTRTIHISDGGATFQLGADLSSKSTLGLNNMFSSALGEAGLGYLADLKSGGSYDLATDSASAMNIIKKVSNQVAQEAARVGGFQQYQIKSITNTLDVTQQNLMAAKSSIEDVDYAQETANLSRTKLLQEATLSFFSVLNQQSASVLSLLRNV